MVTFSGPLRYQSATRTGTCPGNPVDIMLLVDGSGSVTSTNFKKQKAFLVDLVKQLPEGSHVACLQFSDSFRWEFKFNSSRTIQNITDAISKIPYRDGTTYTAAAMKEAAKEMAKFDPTKITMILLTDGIADDWSKNNGTGISAQILASGVTSYAVGVGSNVNVPQLNQIAGDTNRVLMANRFEDLDNDLASTIASGICPTTEEATTTAEPTTRPTTTSEMSTIGTTESASVTNTTTTMTLPATTPILTASESSTASQSDIRSTSPITTTTSPDNLVVEIFRYLKEQKPPDTLSMFTAIQSILPLLMSGYDDDEKQTKSYSPEELIIISNQVLFEAYVDPVYGNCFKLVENNTVVGVGRSNALEIDFNGGSTGDIPAQETPGLRVMVHAPDIQVFPDAAGVDAPAGYISTVFIERLSTKRLPWPYGQCVIDGKKNVNFSFPKGYTIEGCYRTCRLEYLLKACSCRDPRLGNSIDDGTRLCTGFDYFCLEIADKNESQEWYKSCHCPQACRESFYDVSSTLTPYKETDYNSTTNNTTRRRYDPGRLFIFLQSEAHALLEEVPLMTIEQLLASLGGFMGIWLGMSVIAGVEILMFIGLMGSICNKKCCERSKRGSSDVV